MKNSFRMYLIRFLFKPAFIRKYYFSMSYRYHSGKKLNLENPKTWTEKLLWMNKYWQPELKSKCADKYAVRDYVSSKGLKDILIPLIGVWDDVKDIDFTMLPDKFAIKCNHGCACNVLCTDKSNFDEQAAIKHLSSWLKRDYSDSGELHYHFIQPKIICESFLPVDHYSELIDYKIHCFDGTPMFIGYCYDRNLETQNSKGVIYSPKWERLLYLKDDKPNDGIKMPKPSTLDQMLEIARILSRDIPYVRVDLYSIKGKVYFGELTFTPDGAILEREYKKGVVAEYGNYITLPAKIERKW